MPPQETSHRFQPAVLWPATGVDSYGQPTVGAPVEIMVRWNTGRSEQLDPQGNSVSLDASAVVGQRIAIGSNMWLGELADWYGTGSNATDSELMLVKTYNEVPDIKARFVSRTVGLMRFRAVMSDQT